MQIQERAQVMETLVMNGTFKSFHRLTQLSLIQRDNNAPVEPHVTFSLT